MSRINEFQRLFDQLEQMSVGFTPLFREFQVPQVNYPPHNLVRVSDTETILELAVAGFKKNEITMEEHQGILTVKGTKEGNIDQSDYQYRGIAARSFSKSWRLNDYYEVAGAALEDGILTVKLVRNVPETAKPKLIAIK